MQSSFLTNYTCNYTLKSCLEFGDRGQKGRGESNDDVIPCSSGFTWEADHVQVLVTYSAD